MKKKKTSSILRKFLLFNLSIFSVLGLFTILYLNAIQPNLVKKVSSSHFIIINNTSDHIERLGVEFNKEGIKQFLLSTRFLFQGLDRVQFFSDKLELIGDTNILDLDTSVFEKSDEVIEEGAEKTDSQIKPLIEEGSELSLITNTIKTKYKDKPIKYGEFFIKQNSKNHVYFLRKQKTLIAYINLIYLWFYLTIRFFISNRFEKKWSVFYLIQTSYFQGFKM